MVEPDRQEARMRALEIIDEAQSGAAVANLARALGISETEAHAAVAAALPEMIRGIERNTLSRAGLAGLVSAIGEGHHEQILDSPAAWTDPRAIADGQAVLNHIMGSERNAERLAANTAQVAGLGSGIIKLLLPILAQWLLGALTKSTKGGLGDILSRLPIPGGGASQRPSRPRSSRNDGGFDTGGTMGDNSGFELPKSTVPAGGYPMPPIPGADDDTGGVRNRRQPDVQDNRNTGGFGFPWPGSSDTDGRNNDRPRSGGGMGLPRSDAPAGGYPMPPLPPAPEGDDYGTLPRAGDQGNSDNPYGDLSDILRRGGRLPSGDKAGGRGLGSIVRDTIGSALGFGNKGIVGWIIQLLLLRWGWSFLRRILLGR
jgi:hypothetical protein